MREATKQGASSEDRLTTDVPLPTVTTVYHLPTCPHYARLSAKNLVRFASEEQAQQAGYRNAGDCR